jgi:GNAT superfamily N-acetyltransferase
MLHPSPPAERTPIEITDDRARLDVTRIFALYVKSLWARGRSADAVRRAVDHSHPVVTPRESSIFVGFARVISDLTYRAPIWDVIVRPSHQGRGIGAAVMRFVLGHPDLKSVSHSLLVTVDKTVFYQGFDFQAEREMAMMLRR